MKTKLYNLVAGSILATSGTNLVFAQLWTATSAPEGAWTAIACSADGNKLVAARYESTLGSFFPHPIYISADSGLTWIQSSSPSKLFIAVASSADGTKLVAATGKPDQPYY